MLDRMLYDVLIEGPGDQVRITWGSSPDWKKRYAETIANAKIVSIVSKDRSMVQLPMVSVQLSEGRKLVLETQVHGTLTGKITSRVRVYCIGYEQEVNGQTVRHVTWVYPNGIIEIADEPSYWRHLLRLQETTRRDPKLH